jgi:hypothetical protein
MFENIFEVSAQTELEGRNVPPAVGLRTAKV